MKPHKLFYFWLLIWASFSCFGQAGIFIEHANKHKSIFIEENKRLYIRTKDGQAIKGYADIIDSTHIQILNHKLNINEIVSIPKNNWLISFVTSSIIIYIGGALFGIASLNKAFLGESWKNTSPTFAASVAVCYIGLKSPRFQRTYKRNKGWTFKFIATPSLPNSVLPNDRN